MLSKLEIAGISPIAIWFLIVNIFESFYIPKRCSEGWVIINGGSNNDDRFKVIWQVGDEVIVGQYNDMEWTVTERLRKPKK